MSEEVYPPFNTDQVASLDAYQASGVFHPFTCGTAGCRRPLTADPDGLQCPTCGSRFHWAWAWMADWSWRLSAEDRPFKGWWMLYPVRGDGWPPHKPGPEDRPDPRFPVGATARLRGRPGAVRRVLAVEWHSIRREFAYVVETSATGSFRPYWFAAQLLVAG